MRSGRMGTVEPELLANTLGDIHHGDLNQGDGVSSQQLGRVGIEIGDDTRDRKADAREAAGKSATENFLDNVMGKKRSGGGSLGIWIVAIALLVMVKIVSEKAGEAGEFSTVRIGLENWFIVGALALTFGYVFKVSAALLPSNSKIAQSIREFAGAS
jgi:hypothetical protein